MDQITRNKILIGSLYRNINHARLYGKLDLKMLYFLELIHNYILECEHPTEFKDRQKLNQLSLIIQNKYWNICNYRFNDTIKFATIVGCQNCKPGLNNNPLQVFNNNPIISDPDPINPQVECPTFCQNSITKQYDGGLSFVNLFSIQSEFDLLTGSCYYSYQGSPVKYLKFNTLPSNGTLIYTLNGVDTIVTIGTVIDLDIFDILTYIYNNDGTGSPKTNDSFQFSLGDSQTPTLYTTSIIFNLVPTTTVTLLPTLCSNILKEYSTTNTEIFKTTSEYSHLTTVCYFSPTGSPANELIIKTTPTNGNLILSFPFGGKPLLIQAGMNILITDLQQGTLEYQPSINPGDDTANNEDYFTISITDSNNPSLETNTSKVTLRKI